MHLRRRIVGSSVTACTALGLSVSAALGLSVEELRSKMLEDMRQPQADQYVTFGPMRDDRSVDLTITYKNKPGMRPESQEARRRVQRRVPT